MGMLTKVMVVVNLVLAIGVAALTFTLWAKQLNWVAEAETATNKFNETQAKLNTVQREFDMVKQNYANELNTAATQLAAANARRDALSREVDDLKQRVGSAETSNKEKDGTLRANNEIIEQMRQTNDTLRASLDKLRADSNEARQVMEKAKTSAVSSATELKAANDQVRSLIASRNVLMNRVDALEQLMQRYTEIYPDLPATAVAGTETNVEGLVAQVDHDSGLLVIKVGERGGARKGLILTLSRGDKYLGRCVVRQVEPDFLVAAISEMTPDPQQIRVGDDARTLY